jgi:RecB family exonuclease
MRVASITKLRQVIHNKFSDPLRTLVFPTESSRRYWLEDYAYKGEAKVVRGDQALAWDTFKANFLPTSEAQPVNQTIRFLFSQKFLEEENLKWFSYPNKEYSNQNLAKALVNTLLALPQIKRYGKESFPKEYWEDLIKLEKSYLQFLKEQNLFDPSFFLPSPDNYPKLKEQKITLFFPEVCDGFEQFETILEDIEIIKGEEVKEASFLNLYQNEMIELRSTISQIEKLLVSGVETHEIVISVGNLKRWQPYLEHLANLADLPISIVDSKAIGEFKSFQLFKNLIELHTKEYPIESLRSFLLDLSYPWKDLESQKELINELVKLKGENKESQLIKLTRSNSKYTSWYKNFTNLNNALFNAKNVDQLRTALLAFTDKLFKKSMWESELEHNAFRFIVDKLEEVKEALNKSNLKPKTNLFSFFIDRVEESYYVPAVKREGILVYPYKVGVALGTKYHYVVATTFEQTNIVEGSFPLIGESDYLAERKDDLSNIYLNHYQLTSDNLIFSASEVMFGNNSALIPPYFINHDAIKEHSSFIRDDKSFLEQQRWTLLEDKVFSVTPKKLKEFQNGKISAFRRSVKDMGNTKEVLDVVKDKINQLKLIEISPSQLDNYTICPMRWALSHLLKVKEGEFVYQQIDHLAIGSLLHKILESFFKEVRSRTTIFSASHLNDYEKLLIESATKFFDDYEKQVDAPRKTTLHYIRDLYMEQLQLVVIEESKKFEDFESVAFEQKISREYKEKGYLLNGIIDRFAINEKESRVAIIDYKKSFNTPLKATKEDPTSLKLHQLPFYALLLQEGDDHYQVTEAAYYNIQKGRYAYLWEFKDQQLRDEFIEVVKEHLDVMVATLKKGIIGATPSNEGCRYCTYRQVCRRRYALQ